MSMVTDYCPRCGEPRKNGPFHKCAEPPQQPYDTSGDAACTELTCPAHGELNRLRADLARKDERLADVEEAHGTAILDLADARDALVEAQRERATWETRYRKVIGERNREAARAEQAERDCAVLRKTADDEHDAREQAERQVREIREGIERQHRKGTRYLNMVPFAACSTCIDGNGDPFAWPCPTIRALSGVSGPTTEGASDA